MSIRMERSVKGYLSIREASCRRAYQSAASISIYHRDVFREQNASGTPGRFRNPIDPRKEKGFYAYQAKA